MTYRHVDDIMYTLDTIDMSLDMKKVTIDNLGRIVIPIGWRRELNLSKNSVLLLSFDGERIVAEKEKATCKLCDVNLDNKNALPLCTSCINKMKQSGE